MNELPQRKKIRMEKFDYSSEGLYFITICTKEHKEILSKIVGTGVLDGPQTILSEYGVIADRQMKFMTYFYDSIKILKYVIMPNHIHLLLQVSENAPTTDNRNSTVSKFVGTFKRFCNKEYGHNIWQARSFDRVVRNEEEYRKIWNYIESNPSMWNEDRYNRPSRRPESGPSRRPESGPSRRPVPTVKGENNG